MHIHFLELRKRIIYCLFFFITIFIVLFYFADITYDLFSTPITKQINTSLIAIKITSTFIIPLKLSFYLATIICTPYILFNIWRFIAPGLYKKEKYTLKSFFILSILLFTLGISFAFYIICPIALNFFLNCSPSNVNIMISIDNYLDFIFTIILATGVSFQIPLIINIIIKSNLITKKSLANKRPYIIIFAFIISMLLTPPDVISQILLAIPMCILFEIGLIFSK